MGTYENNFIIMASLNIFPPNFSSMKHVYCCIGISFNHDWYPIPNSGEATML